MPVLSSCQVRTGLDLYCYAFAISLPAPSFPQTATRALTSQSTVTSSRWSSKSPRSVCFPAATCARAFAGIEGSERVILGEGRGEGVQDEEGEEVR